MKNETIFVVIGVLAIGGLIGLVTLAKALRHEFLVYAYESGLLFKDGVLRGLLPAGRHVRLGKNYEVRRVDLRPTQLAIPNQEILTRDGVSVRVTATIAYRVADPERVILGSQNYVGDAYLIVQTALRDAVTPLTADEVLENRMSIGATITEACKGNLDALGIELSRIELRDVTFPTELKAMFAKVVAAQKEGLAALERARGESAAMRSLANTAKLLDNNPSLGQLRMLQALGDSYSTTVVLNASGLPVSVTGN
jgi:regulator of protease activity HflC (stomatin/prohibitin superfamily)